jgi:hypothetical protein
MGQNKARRSPGDVLRSNGSGKRSRIRETRNCTSPRSGLVGLFQKRLEFWRRFFRRFDRRHLITADSAKTYGNPAPGTACQNSDGFPVPAREALIGGLMALPENASGLEQRVPSGVAKRTAWQKRKRSASMTRPPAASLLQQF